MSNTETELKLRLTDSTCLERLLHMPLLQQLSDQPPNTQTLETTYYDTTDHRLLLAGLSYRLRLANGQWTATVKADGSSDGGLHRRTEFNASADGRCPSIVPFLATDIGERLAAAAGEMSLEPIFSTRFERHIVNIVAPDGSSIELALDDGIILAGDKQQPILELELELKAGQPQSLLWLGAALAQEFPLLPEQNSKLYRAIQLAGLAAGLGKDKPQPSPLKKSNASLPAGQVLSQIIIYHIQKVICAQQAYLSELDDDPEPLHNLRISLRRLRSLLSFAKPLLPKTEYSDRQSGLADWNRQLGQARNLDVLAAAWDELNDYMAKLLPNQAIKPTLTTILADKRQQVRAETYNAVAAGKITPVLLGLWSFIEAWRIEEPQTPCPDLKEFAEERLAYRLKQLLKRGSSLVLTDCQSAHEFRIAAKNIRYALEALAPILQNNSKLLCKRLEKIQDLLGSIQDITLTLSLLQQLVKASASRLAHRDAGLITGWQLAKSTEAAGKWVKVWTKTEKAAGKFKKLHSPTPRYPQKKES